MNGHAFDIALVGGGHNGLTAAAYLARAGLKVVVLEAAERTGGAGVHREIHPGFHAPALAHLLPALDERVVRDLDLARLGLDGRAAEPATVALSPDAGALELPPEPDRAARALAARSRRDAEAYPAFCKRLQGHASALRAVFARTPPTLNASNRADMARLGQMAWAMRRRGKAAMRDFLRIVGMNVADLLDEVLETPALQGVFAADAVWGTNHGPRSPNTVFTLLHRMAGGAAGREGRLAWPAGGPERLVNALAASARAAGADIRTDARVTRIVVEAGTVRGAELEDGSVISADSVVSSADPLTTCAALVGPDHLDADFLRDIRAFRTRGLTGKVNFALDRMPALPGAQVGKALRWVLAPSIDYVEEAFDCAKYGQAPPAPALEITVPSLHDDTLAPQGKHVMSVNVAYAPYTDEEDASVLQRTVTHLIEPYAPGFGDSVLACEAMGPHAIESAFGIAGGHWHHGDIALDQFFMLRPVPGFAQYRLPVSGLYLCGAGAHPGGGMTATAGANAAAQILRDRKHRRKSA